MCYNGSLADIPFNFKQFIYDLFDESKNKTVYDQNATHSFDKSLLHTFYTKRPLTATTGRMFFYFDQAFGTLKWIRYEA